MYDKVTSSVCSSACEQREAFQWVASCAERGPYFQVARVRSKSAHFTKIEMYDWIVDYDDPCSGFDPLTRDLNQAE